MLSLTRSTILKRLVVYKDSTFNWRSDSNGGNGVTNRPIRHYAGSIYSVRRSQSSLAASVTASNVTAGTTPCPLPPATTTTTKEQPSAGERDDHQLVNRYLAKLDLDVKRNGRIFSRDFHDFFDTIKTITPTSNQSLIAIRCCGAFLNDELVENRNQYLKELWSHLQQRNVALDISHYNSLLAAYLHNDYEFNPVDILTELKEKQLEPNRVTYQRLLHKYCLDADMAGATEILQRMRSADIPINETVFNSLALGYCVSGDFVAAKNTLELMRESGLEPSQDTYSTLLVGHIQNMPSKAGATVEQVQKSVEQLLKEAQHNDIILSDRHLLQVIRNVQLADDSPLFDLLLSKLTKSFNYNQECVSAIIDVINSHRIPLALRLLQTLNRLPSDSNLKREGHSAPQTNANFFIQQMIKANVDRNTVVGVLTKFKEEHFNDLAFNKAAEYALQHADRESARFYLNKFLEQNELPARPHYFWPILRKCTNNQDLFDVVTDLRMLSESQQLQRTFREFVWPIVQGGKAEMIEKFVEIGFNRGTIVSTSLQHLLFNNRLAEAQELVQSVQEENFMHFNSQMLYDLASTTHATQNPQAVFKFLTDFVRLSNPNVFSQFLEKLVSHNASRHQLPAYLKLCVQNQVYVAPEVTAMIVRLVPNLSSEDQQTLHDLARNISVNRRGQTNDDQPSFHQSSNRFSALNPVKEQIVQLCWNRTNGEPLTVEQRAERIEELVAQLEKGNYSFDDTLKNALITFYSLFNKQLEKCIHYCGLLRNDFRLENDKVLAIAWMYAERDRLEEALALLEENASKDNVRAKLRSEDRMQDRVERFGHQLLTVVLEKRGDHELYDRFLAAMLRLTNQPPVNRWLGLKIKTRLQANELDKALEDYYRFMHTYKRCPWKGELMRVLIEKEDSTALQKLSDESMKIHGEANVLIDLSVAFLLAGRERQAKKIMETPGLRIFQDRVDAIGENLVRTDQLPALERFIEISKNLVDINRHKLYLQLLRGFIRQEQPDKALNVWTSMQEENLLPSYDLLHELGAFLQKCGRPIPFELPSKQDDIRVYQKYESGQSSFSPSSTNNTAGGKENLNLEFMKALRANNLSQAAQIRAQLAAQGSPLSLNEECSYITTLLNAGQVQNATELVHEMLVASRFPTPMVIRNLLSKLCSLGQWQEFERLEPLLPTTILETSTYNSHKLEAYMNGKKSDEFLVERLRHMKPFPLVSILKLLDARPQLEPALVQMSSEFSNTTDYHLPLNFIWIHQMMNRQFDKAEELFAQVPAFQSKLLYKTILERINQQNDAELCNKLVHFVNQTSLSSRAVGNVYNTLLKTMMNLDQIEQAEQVLMQEVVNNESAKTSIDDIDRRTLTRWSNLIETELKRPAAFPIPKEETTANETTPEEGETNDDSPVLEQQHRNQ